MKNVKYRFIKKKTLEFNEDFAEYSIIVTILLTIYTLTRGSEYAFFWQEMALGANYQ